YLNTEIMIEAPEPETFPHLELSRIHVNGAPVPSDLLEWTDGSRSLRDYVSQYAEIVHVGSMQIRDGKLVLHSHTD
ncbi:MAG: hypothetical protein ACREIW_06835, partial [Chthoniobacterales bacterium]